MSWLDTRPREMVDSAVETLSRQDDPRATELIERDAGGDVRFALWLALVDKRLRNAVGVGRNDLADWAYRDSYDAGDSPAAAAAEVLRADGTFAELLGDE
jgi:hypothetical protein